MNDSIRALAARFLEEGWTWTAAGREPLPAAEAAIVPVLDVVEKSLTPTDRRFQGYVAVVERPTDSPSRALARAKLATLLTSAMASLRIEKTLSGEFQGAALFDRFPELADSIDDDDLVPTSLFEPLPDALSYEDSVVGYSEYTPLFLRRRLSRLMMVDGLDLRVRLAPTAPVPRSDYRERLE
ncbi:MAG TPA: hypothetical protein VLT82_08370, partial [Myxococcaceae bacterium]|nr:hypothetical protein [Myxococcaceae bacterium]